MDPQARHGHKTAARGFDGYKGHVGIDPDSEIITATTVSAGNAGDAAVTQDLIADLLETPEQAKSDSVPDEGPDDGAAGGGRAVESATAGDDDADDAEHASVYGDNAYGTGGFHDRLERAGIESKCKTQQPANSGGRFSKNEFGIDLERESVTCPAGNTVPIRRGINGAGSANFGPVCAHCPCVSSAPPPRPGATSASGSTRNSSPRRGPGNNIRTGSPTTGRPDRRWNARSGT